MAENKGYIKRALMLDMMDIRFKPDGKPMIYSCKFVDLQGKLRFFPQCTVRGCGKMNMKEKRMRGLQPCDCVGHEIDHVYPVKIDNIVEWQGKSVTSEWIDKLD